MIIVGADYHPGFQQIAFVDTETGDCGEQRLQHPEEAEKFYRELAAHGMKVRVGMEASGHARWFERLLGELKFELWVGDATEIETKRVRKPKTDREDARLLLRLLMEDRFPRIWVPSWDNRDLRQLLWHRHRMVQARTRIMNQLQAVALNEGLRFKKRLWREAGRQQLESFPLAPWANRRRHDLLALLDRPQPDHCGAEPGHRARSREVSRGAALDDASGSGSVNRTGLRADHRNRGAISVWETDRQLLGISPAREVEWKSTTTRAHHEARKLDVAFLAGGSGPSHGAQHPRMAQQVFPPSAATRQENRQGRHGAQISRSSVLDVAQAVGL